MDFFKSAFEAMPHTATHPFAFVSYLVVIISWLALTLKVKRNKQLLTNLEKLPQKDRLEALRLEMGAVQLREGLSPENWIKHRQYIYYFLAFLASCLVFVVLFAIAAVEASKFSKLGSSKEELIQILKTREEKFVTAIDVLIVVGTEEDAKELESLKTEVLAVNKKRIAAIREGNLVLVHELGNDLDHIQHKYDVLIPVSIKQKNEYERLVVVLSTMDPRAYMEMKANVETETVRLKKLEFISKMINQITPPQLRGDQ